MTKDISTNPDTVIDEPAAGPVTTPCDSDVFSLNEHWIDEFTKYDVMTSKVKSNTANNSKKSA